MNILNEWHCYVQSAQVVSARGLPETVAQMVQGYLAPACAIADRSRTLLSSAWLCHACQRYSAQTSLGDECNACRSRVTCGYCHFSYASEPGEHVCRCFACGSDFGPAMLRGGRDPAARLCVPAELHQPAYLICDVCVPLIPGEYQCEELDLRACKYCTRLIEQNYTCHKHRL